MNSKYIEDLNFIIDKYEKTLVCPYYCFSKEEINKYIDEYLRENVINDDLEFLYFLKTILKKLNGILDSHTTVRIDRKFFPFALKILDDEIYVINTTSSNREFLYTKLISVNNIPYKSLISELEPTISYGTEGWKKHNLERDFNEYYSLLYLPSLRNNNNIKLKFLNENGRILNFNCNMDDEFIQIKENTENCSYEILDDTIHYIYNSCLIEYSDKVKKTVIELDKLLKNRKINNFILDLRDNIGGGSRVIKPLIKFLANSNLNLYTFVNRNTFSSGIMALEEMLNLGSITIGEDAGSTINHFGSVDAVFNLPNTNFTLKLCTKYFPFNKTSINNQNDFKSKIQISDMQPVYFKPDICVEEHIYDYKNNIDVYMKEFYKKVKKNDFTDNIIKK